MVTEDSHQTDVDATHLERVDESGIKTVLNMSLEKHWKCPNAVDLVGDCANEHVERIMM